MNARTRARHRRAACCIAIALSVASPALANAASGDTTASWSGAGGGLRLDEGAMATAMASDAPVISVPDPDGELHRFRLTFAPVQSPEQQRAFPAIRTFTGVGVDDPSAIGSFDITPRGFHASVTSSTGRWVVDPAGGNRYRSALPAPAERAVEQELARTTATQAAAPAAGKARRAGAPTTRRVYRLALINDPSFARQAGGTDAGVQAAKATLINRVNQVYNDDLGVRLQLVGDAGRLNLGTAARFGQGNGPCGSFACYPDIDSRKSCSSAVIADTAAAAPILMGTGPVAPRFDTWDIAHVIGGEARPDGVGPRSGELAAGGGIAQEGAGSTLKGWGCSTSTTPTTAGFAVGTIAHEIGHQLGASHSFNGTAGGCDQRESSETRTDVEPGSGSSIMGYNGLCDADDLQVFDTDPYFHPRTVEQIATYQASTQVVDASQRVLIPETGTSTGLRLSVPDEAAVVVNWEDYTAAKFPAAVATAFDVDPEDVTVTRRDDVNSAIQRDGFIVQITNDQDADTPAPGRLSVTLVGGDRNAVAATTQSLSREAAPTNAGAADTATANVAPVVTTPAAFTIPQRTPFVLSGAVTDPDGDVPVSLWEEMDPGLGSGAPLLAQSRVRGPLFRQFGTRATTGPNAATPAGSTRSFPDPAQVALDNTNAARDCATAPDFDDDVFDSRFDVPGYGEAVDCFSEQLPTARWLGTNDDRAMHFRLVARDRDGSGGGVGTGNTTLTVAPAAGPFRVTTSAVPSTLTAGQSLAVGWDVAGTDANGVDTATVAISLSTDGGLTFPYQLDAGTPNDGVASVTVPAVATAQARIKVAAVGNAFYDVSHADATIVVPAAPSDTGAGTGGGAGAGTTGGGAGTGGGSGGGAVTPPAAPKAKLAAAKRLKVSKKGTVAVKLSCPAACKGTLTLSAKAGKRRLSAKKAFSLKAGRTGTVTLKLPKALRKAAARKALKATLAARTTAPGATPTTTTGAVRLGHG